MLRTVDVCVFGLQGLLGVLSYVCMYVCTSLPESEGRCRHYYWHSHTLQELHQVWKVVRRRGRGGGGERGGVEGMERRGEEGKEGNGNEKWR